MRQSRATARKNHGLPDYPEPKQCGGRSAGFQPAYVVRRSEAAGSPVVFAARFSDQGQRLAKRTITVGGRPERAGRPRSDCIAPAKSVS